MCRLKNEKYHQWLLKKINRFHVRFVGKKNTDEIMQNAMKCIITSVDRYEM